MPSSRFYMLSRALLQWVDYASKKWNEVLLLYGLALGIAVPEKRLKMVSKDSPDLDAGDCILIWTAKHESHPPKLTQYLNGVRVKDV